MITPNQGQTQHILACAIFPPYLVATLGIAYISDKIGIVTMNSLIYIALGGALGASGRHVIGQMVQKWSGESFPYGTMIVNVVGSFLMGLLIGWMAFKLSGAENWRLFLGVGLLGGFTTFSAFSLDAMLLFEKKAYGAFLSYVGGSVILSLLALMMGLIIMRKFGAA